MLIYSCIILLSWYNATYLSDLIIQHPMSAFLFQECIYWIFGIFCWVLDECQVKKFKAFNPRPDTLSESKILPIVIRNHLILTVFHYVYCALFTFNKVDYTFLEFVINLLVFITLFDILFLYRSPINASS